MNNKKVYVDITLRITKEGKVYPLAITWKDDRIFEIDRVKQVCKATSLKVGGCGTRYTVSICGKETYLFQEDERWFMEEK